MTSWVIPGIHGFSDDMDNLMCVFEDLDIPLPEVGNPKNSLMRKRIRQFIEKETVIEIENGSIIDKQDFEQDTNGEGRVSSELSGE